MLKWILSKLYLSGCHLWGQQSNSPVNYFLLHPLKHTPPLPHELGSCWCCPPASPAQRGSPHSAKARLSPCPAAVPAYTGGLEQWSSSGLDHKCLSPHSEGHRQGSACTAPWQWREIRVDVKVFPAGALWKSPNVMTTAPAARIPVGSWDTWTLWLWWLLSYRSAGPKNCQLVRIQEVAAMAIVGCWALRGRGCSQEKDLCLWMQAEELNSVTVSCFKEGLV